MSAPAWTPGPWGAVWVPELSATLIGTGDRVTAFARMESWGGQPDPKTQDANANLIAAAPDLFAALEGLLNITGDMHNEDFDEFKDAEAALAKARGQ